MTWSKYAQILSISYPLYYLLNIVYDLTVTHRQAGVEIPKATDYDLSYMDKSASESPQKVSEMNRSHTHSSDEEKLRVTKENQLQEKETSSVSIQSVSEEHEGEIEQFLQMN